MCCNAFVKLTSDPLPDPLHRAALIAMLATQRHSWEQGVAMQALDAAGQREALVSLAYAAVKTTAVADGRIGVMPGPDEDGAVDSCACGIPLARAHELTGAFADAVTRLERWARVGAPRGADGVVYHEMSKPTIWSDSFFMLPPFLADCGRPDEALAQIRGYWRVLHDPGTGLVAHIWDATASSLIDPALWATGVGWAAAGMAQVMERIPDAAQRVELLGMIQTLLDGLAPFQRPDGLFHNTVDDAETFVETAGGALVAYAIFTGVASGWLPAKYAAMATRIRKAARSRVGQYGFLDGGPGAPDFDKPGISAEAQAAFLLMEMAAAKAN